MAKSGLRESARDEACVNCGAQDGTIVLAHLPYQGISDGGIGRKCDDFVSAYLCHRCHTSADSGPFRRDVFWRYQMNVRTWRRMIEKGVIKL